MNRSGRLIKESFILGMGQFVPKFIALVTVPLLTLRLTTDEYGIYDLLITIQSLVMPLLTLQIQQAVFRKLLSESHDRRGEIIGTTVRFISASFIIGGGIVFGVLRIIGLNISMASLAVILCIVFSLYDLLGQTVRGYGSNVTYAVGILIQTVTNAIILILAFCFWDLNVFPSVMSLVIAYIVAGLVYFFSNGIFTDYRKRSYSGARLKSLLAYSMPLIPSTLALWAVNMSDRMLISFFVGLDSNGIYAAANKIPNFFASVYAVFNLAWTESASRANDKDDDSESYYTKAFSALHSFLVGTFLLLIPFSPVMFRLLIDSKFSDAIYQMPILYIGVFYSCLVSFMGGIYVAKQKTKEVGISSGIGAILNIVINVCLIGKFGLYAASVSTVISFLAIYIFRMADISKHISFPINFRNTVFQEVVLIAACLICMLNSVIALWIVFILGVIFNIYYNGEMFRKVIALIKTGRNG